MAKEETQMSEELRTIPEWEKYTGITILDPDGFDRSDPFLEKRLMTKEHFIMGSMGSTVFIKTGDFKTFNGHLTPELEELPYRKVRTRDMEKSN